MLAVRDAARAALERARGEYQPKLLEAVSYRLRGHSVVDPAKYRTAEDAERLRQGDPLPAFRARLWPPESSTRRLRRRSTPRRTGGDRRRGLRRRQPAPDVATLFDYMYATPVASTYPRAARRAADGPGRPGRVGTGTAQGRTAGVAVISYRQALHDTLRAEMRRDENVLLIGEEIGVFEGSYKITAGLLAEFGRAGSVTPRSPRKASPGSRSAPRCSGCGRWWRS